MNNERDLELLYELGTLRYMNRVWKQFGGPNVANVAEHTLRVAWIAQILAVRERADVGKVLRMALMHDLGKTRAGDAHWLNRAYVKRDEGNAIAASTTDTAVADDAPVLWDEFKAGKTLEAKIVKDADNLDVDLEFRERREDWPFARTNDDIRQAVYTKKLRTNTAKQLWQDIQTSDPSHWYVEVFHTPEAIGELGAAEN
jgi:5'-deoxynucleotidase YfbR-like HD superfamily hydrolase